MPSPESGSTRPGGVADGERAAVRDPRGRTAHRQAVPADLRQRRPGDAVALADAAQVIAQVRPLRVPAADADVGVVALREEPAVAAGDVAHLEQRHVLLHARADGLVGDVGLERRSEDAALAELQRAPADAVGAVRRDEHLGARARAVVERDGRAAVLLELDACAARTPSRKCAPASAACSARKASRRLRWVISTTGARPPCANAPRSGWRKPIVVIWRSTTGPIAKGSRRAPRSVTPPPHGLSRGKRARSTSSVRTPSAASRCAVTEPAGPAPTTMTSNRSTLGAYDLGMGDSSVRVEDAGDLRVRQAMVGRPKSVSRDASIGDARILFANPKNRLLLVVDDDDLYVGHVLREDVPDAEPDEAPLLSHVRRDCPTDRPGRQRRGGAAAGERCVRQPARRGRRRRPPRGPALPQQARRLPLRGRARMTGVHRSELTPVAFLQRAAYLHPARVAVAHEDGRRITYGELEERCHRLANALRGARAARTATASPCSRPTRRRFSRRTTPCRSRAACWSPSTRASRRPRSATSCATRARASCSSTTRSRRSSSRSTWARSTSCASTTAARADDPYEQLIASGAPERPETLARARGGADLDQLHLGHDRRAQGRRLHASRRVPERARRGDRGRAHARERLPLDAADVPLQRLVLPLGRDGGRPRGT